MPDDLARQRSLLATALVAAQLPETGPDARMLRAWLDTWLALFAESLAAAGQHRRRPGTTDFLRDRCSRLRRKHSLGFSGRCLVLG